MNCCEEQYLLDRWSSLNRADAIDRSIDFLRKNHESLLDLLTEHASYRAAEAEITSSIKALQGAMHEVGLMQQGKYVEKMAVFMPSNIVLYSYVLYLMIPSLYTARIEFRPATVVAEQIQQLHQMLNPVHRLPITLQPVSQRVFMEKCVESAKVVLFTGAYANAERIKTHINSNHQMYVFLGQGVNPIIITETADLDEAVTGVITARLFNTGQDCMGPDVIFVQQGVARPFLDILGDKLVGLTFGSRKDPNADYSPIYYSSTIEVISQYMSRNARYISYGGAIDYAKKKIEPTVLFSSLRDKPDIIEFFGPIFNVVSYDDEESLKYELSQNFYRERAMGASLYGGGSLIDFLKLHHSVSVNATLFEIEDGNKPFGGYGPMANYIYCNKRLKAEPILLSQIVSDYL